MSYYIRTQIRSHSEAAGLEEYKYTITKLTSGDYKLTTRYNYDVFLPWKHHITYKYHKFNKLIDFRIIKRQIACTSVDWDQYADFNGGICNSNWTTTEYQVHIKTNKAILILPFGTHEKAMRFCSVLHWCKNS